ncbi:MAG TPA: inositol monophosphatase family protein [Nocardioides sp.]|nr:inositol monophosphatase family protein [Nocardioides sp.]
MTGPAGPGRPDPRVLLDLALEVAADAADLVRRHAAGVVEVAATKTSDIDVVTAADRATEELIRERILGKRPDDAFLGEEGDDVAGTSGVRWIVDPIDGTVNFLYGIPDYAVSIAAEVDGEVVAGVVADVAKEDVYAGHAGGVATRNGHPVAVRPPAPLAHRLVATGFSYTRSVRVVQAAATARLLGDVRDIRRAGACALDLCKVAAGALDGYVEEGVNTWDHAAGALIARLAGARTLLAPGAAGREALVCAPAHGFDEFLDAVRKAGFLRE